MQFAQSSRTANAVCKSPASFAPHLSVRWCDKTSLRGLDAISHLQPLSLLLEALDDLFRFSDAMPFLRDMTSLTKLTFRGWDVRTAALQSLARCSALTDIGIRAFCTNSCWVSKSV
jgi:hypothetical protein